MVQNKPVVCQTCHYTPALDVAQLGPLAGAPGTVANGRNRLAHQSNSRVMHWHHGNLSQNGFPGLFPAIPAPTQDANGVITNQAAREAALEASCYRCHPGKTTKCLRGPMRSGDMLCGDCHGSMAQVGNDFSQNVKPETPGAFLLAKDFYTNPDTPRVPWANEPGCGSLPHWRCGQPPGRDDGDDRQQEGRAGGSTTTCGSWSPTARETPRRRRSCRPTSASPSPWCRPPSPSRTGCRSPTRARATRSSTGSARATGV